MSQQELEPGPKARSVLKRMVGNRVVVQTGQLVRSSKGRDRGRFYLVIGRDGLARVQVADGEVRKVENPKHKKIKHLQVYDQVAGVLSTKAESGRRITNVDLRQELKSLLQNLEERSI